MATQEFIHRVTRIRPKITLEQLNPLPALQSMRQASQDWIPACPPAVQRFHQEHPVAVKVAGAGLIVAGGVVLGPAIAVGGLNAVGFTSAGVAAGSIATGIQSYFYAGATTGLFSLCQSIGATAVAASPAAVIPALGSVAAGLGLVRTSQPQQTTRK